MLENFPSHIDYLSPEDNIDAYQHDIRGTQGKAVFVMRPKTTAEVSACVAWCQQQNVPFIPQSANTGLTCASIPDASGTQAVLSLEKVTSTFDLSLPNRSVTVSAGMRLSELNARLLEHDLFMPIELGSDPMIGGMVATNTGGARLLRYGDMRRQVLGLTVVLPDSQGSVVQLGKGLRKDNTGTDWKQFFIGATKQPGVITEVTLNLEPLPQQQAGALLVPSSNDSVLELLRFFESRLDAMLSAYEFMSRNAMQHVFNHIPAVKHPFGTEAVPEMALLLEVSRTNAPASWETALDDVLEQVLHEAWELPSEPLQDVLLGPLEPLWQLRHSIPAGYKAAGKPITFDVSFKRDVALAFRSAMLKELPPKFPAVEICDFGHIGDGGLHFNLVCHDKALVASPEFTEFELAVRDWVMAQAVERFDGSYSAEHGVGVRNRRYYERYTAPVSGRFGLHYNSDPVRSADQT